MPIYLEWIIFIAVCILAFAMVVFALVGLGLLGLEIKWAIEAFLEKRRVSKIREDVSDSGAAVWDAEE